MKRYALPFFSGILLTLTCVGILIFLFFRSPTRNANCLPIRFPEPPFDNPKYASYVQPFVPEVFRTKTPLQTIKDFYDTNLLHSPNWNDDSEGYWRRSEVRPSEFLYVCGGTISSDETETGCIYLRVRDGVTIVERIWLNQVSVGLSCELYMSELPGELYVNDPSK